MSETSPALESSEQPSQPSQATRMVTVRFPTATYKQLRIAAATAGISMNAFIVRQIELAIQRSEETNA